MVTSLGYQFINDAGYPLSNVLPNIEDAEDVGRYEISGFIYELKHDSTAQVYFLRLVRRVSNTE